MDGVKHSPLPPERIHMDDDHLSSAYSAHPYPTKAPVNHALQDYQMQLLLLERQNKQRLLAARGVHQESSANNLANNLQAECSSAGKHRLQDNQIQLDNLEQEHKKRPSTRFDEQIRKRLQEAREPQAKTANNSKTTVRESLSSFHELSKHRPRLLMLQEQYDMSMQQAKEPQRKLENALGQISLLMPPMPEKPVLSYLESLALPKETNQHQATLEDQASSDDPSDQIKNLSQEFGASARSPHDMNVFVDCCAPQSCAAQALSLNDLEKLAQLERARNALLIEQGQLDAKEPLRDEIMSPENPQVTDIEGKTENANLRSPHDMNAGPIQITLPIRTNSSERESSNCEESAATNLRSPHDMNALPDDKPSHSTPETAVLEHQTQDVSTTMRTQMQQQQLHNQQLFQAYQQEQMHRVLQIREPHAPGFAPASFEYKGTPETTFAHPNDDSEPSSCHVEYAPIEHPLSLQESNRSVVDAFKGETTATVPQLKQIGSKRRPRRGQFPTMSPPRNTPICRIRSRAAAAGVRSLSGTRLSFQSVQEFDDSRVNRANILCHDGVSLAIRLYMEE